MKDREIEEMRGLRRSGLTFEQIADKTHYSVNTVKKYCKGIKRGNSQSLIALKSNPLLALQDLNDMMQGALTTGVSIGSGIDLIQRGFSDESLSDQERALMAMKGGAYVTGIAFGAIKTLQDLAKASKPPASKTIESPAYEDLTERVSELEKDNKMLEKLVQRFKDRNNKV